MLIRLLMHVCCRCRLEFASSSPVARAVLLFYTLSRVQARDALQSAALLALLPGLKSSPGGSSIWSGEGAQGEQQWLHSVLHTLVALITENKVRELFAASTRSVFIGLRVLIFLYLCCVSCSCSTPSRPTTSCAVQCFRRASCHCPLCPPWRTANVCAYCRRAWTVLPPRRA